MSSRGPKLYPVCSVLCLEVNEDDRRFLGVLHSKRKPLAVFRSRELR